MILNVSSVAVFCGSKSGNNPLFESHAYQLGLFLGDKNIDLIYGGGNKGLMAAVANGALKNGGKVIGIIPQVLKEWEHQHDGVTELIVVENMHIRKRMLYEKSDAAIILPGGFGTLDELFEMLTWNQLSIHNKPIIILNSGGFYDALLQHMHNMIEQDFLYNSIEKCLKIFDSPEDIFKL